MGPPLTQTLAKHRINCLLDQTGVYPSDRSNETPTRINQAPHTSHSFEKPFAPDVVGSLVARDINATPSGVDFRRWWEA